MLLAAGRWPQAACRDAQWRPSAQAGFAQHESAGDRPGAASARTGSSRLQVRAGARNSCSPLLPMAMATLRSKPLRFVRFTGEPRNCWLNSSGVEAGEPCEGGIDELAAGEIGRRQIVLRLTLAPGSGDSRGRHPGRCRSRRPGGRWARGVLRGWGRASRW